MKPILGKWSVIRLVRLVVGITAFVQAIIQKDLTLGIIGGFLLLTAIANIGCCGSNGCGVDFINKKKEALYEKLGK